MELILASVDKMDSREIASMTNKDHGHICRDIRSMLEEMGEGGESRFGSSYLSEQNKQVTCYLLPKRECLILASGYSVKLRAAIIDRWAELEAVSAFSIPKTYAEALRLAADQHEVIQTQALQIESQKPAVEFVSKFVESKQTQPLRAVAKVLGVKEKKFVAWLLDSKILYRLNGKLTPKQIHLDEGRFEMKEFVSEANGYANFKMSFTTKGIQWIAAMVSNAIETGEL